MKDKNKTEIQNASIESVAPYGLRIGALELQSSTEDCNLLAGLAVELLQDKGVQKVLEIEKNKKILGGVGIG